MLPPITIGMEQNSLALLSCFPIMEESWIMDLPDSPLTPLSEDLEENEEDEIRALLSHVSPSPPSMGPPSPPCSFCSHDDGRPIGHVENQTSSPPLGEPVYLGLPAAPNAESSPAAPNAESSPVSPTLYDLPQLVQNGVRLYREGKWKEVVSLILCGKDKNGPISVSTANQSVSEWHPISVQRYFSALFGISSKLVVRGITLHLDKTSLWHNALHEDLHLSYSWSTKEGTITAPLNKIPNMHLGTFQEGPDVFIIFPRLYSPARQSYHMNAVEYRLFWDIAIGPSLRTLYDGESPSIIYPAFVKKFSELMISNANRSGLEWLADARFVHIIDTQSVRHPLDSRSSATVWDGYTRQHGLSHEGLLEDVNAGAEWLVDVGLEVSLSGHSVIWRSDSHGSIYEQLTRGELSPEQQRYERLPFAHILDASGCRIYDSTCDTGGSGYVELSATDLPLCGVRECGTRIHSNTVWDVLHKPMNSLSFLCRLAQLYYSTRKDIASYATVRVSSGCAIDALLDFNTDAIWKSCLVFETAVISIWRTLRICALDCLIEIQRQNVTTYMTHGRPAALLTCVTPWIVSTSHIGSLSLGSGDVLQPPVVTASGVIFLRSITLGEGEHDVPHFEDLSPGDYSGHQLAMDRAVDGLSIVQAFHQPNEAVPLVPPPEPAPLGRRPSRVTYPSLGGHRPTGIYRAPPYQNTDFSLPIDGPDPLQDPFVAKMVCTVVNLFFMDLIQSGRTSGHISSWIRDDISSTVASATAVFHQDNLATVFRGVKWKHATGEEWLRTFEVFFPFLCPPNAGYNEELTKCRYFQFWKQLAMQQTVGETAFRLIRRTIWHNIFTKMYWVPMTGPTSIWVTECEDQVKSIPFNLPTIPCPVIMINAPHDPLFLS
ncbi:hypothetical protein NMY22_g487 [Coprinellus aureogranulatus]|nr:hypothetical protein NMY22_g487 [Coprinellus aureogranulatus]